MLLPVCTVCWHTGSLKDCSVFPAIDIKYIHIWYIYMYIHKILTGKGRIEAGFSFTHWSSPLEKGEQGPQECNSLQGYLPPQRWWGMIYSQQGVTGARLMPSSSPITHQQHQLLCFWSKTRSGCNTLGCAAWIYLGHGTVTAPSLCGAREANVRASGWGVPGNAACTPTALLSWDFLGS